MPAPLPLDRPAPRLDVRPDRTAVRSRPAPAPAGEAWIVVKQKVKQVVHDMTGDHRMETLPDDIGNADAA